MLLWAEGAPKLGYRPGVHSTGASLAELGEICAELGMANAVNLDGGGSAQLLVNGQRSLALSDRRETDLDEMERPIPLGLAVY
jgi:exopolysaccharide biosynthesis protein